MLDFKQLAAQLEVPLGQAQAGSSPPLSNSRPAPALEGLTNSTQIEAVMQQMALLLAQTRERERLEAERQQQLAQLEAQLVELVPCLNQLHHRLSGLDEQYEQLAEEQFDLEQVLFPAA